MTSTADSFVNTTREEIAALDVRLLATINSRIRKVAELHRYKEEHGIAFVDPNREAQMLDDRVRENGGPLSDEGLRRFYAELLALIKREV